jgi:hypothetical protein
MRTGHTWGKTANHCYYWGGEHQVVVKWLTLLFNIREVPHSNLGLKTGYPKFFLGFPQFLQANARIVP